MGRKIARIVTKRRPAARYRVKWYDTLAIAFTRARLLDFVVARWIGLEELRVAR